MSSLQDAHLALARSASQFEAALSAAEARAANHCDRLAEFLHQASDLKAPFPQKRTEVQQPGHDPSRLADQVPEHNDKKYNKSTTAPEPEALSTHDLAYDPKNRTDLIQFIMDAGIELLRKDP